jgi:hypothetical protein
LVGFVLWYPFFLLDNDDDILLLMILLMESGGWVGAMLSVAGWRWI